MFCPVLSCVNGPGWRETMNGTNAAELHIPNNEIGPSGAATLAKLVLNRRLRFLNLSGNSVGDSAIGFFAAKCLKWGRIKTAIRVHMEFKTSWLLQQ